MKSEILKSLVQAHANGDEDAFRKAAHQLAASESAAGHTRVAEDLRSIIGKMGERTTSRTDAVVDIARPRGDLAEILEGGHRDERLRDIVLTEAAESKLVRIIQENRQRARIERWGVQPRRRLLLHGPPGCGKTLGAAVLAGEMGLPLMTVRFDALFSRFLGATAGHLRAIFAEMPRRPGVYFFDELDAVAKARGDAQDVGEMNRIVTSFLQLIDADRSASILVAATNHPQLLDHAVFRRFDLVLPFEMPDTEQRAALIRLRLTAFDLEDQIVAKGAELAEGSSFADIAGACDDAVRTMALDGRDRLTETDVLGALADIRCGRSRDV
jgi:SpoVK/Ycf46/Vps4 family AAA+-type ATPase